MKIEVDTDSEWVWGFYVESEKKCFMLYTFMFIWQKVKNREKGSIIYACKAWFLLYSKRVSLPHFVTAQIMPLIQFYFILLYFWGWMECKKNNLFSIEMNEGMKSKMRNTQRASERKNKKKTFNFHHLLCVKSPIEIEGKQNFFFPCRVSCETRNCT
jgi:hypothetical protein